MTGLFGYGPGGVPVALDELFRNHELAGRKLARADRDDENKALTVALLEWRNARGDLGLDPVLEATRRQMGVETIPPGLRRLLGLPPRVIHIPMFVEAAARDALALTADAILTEPTVGLAREVVEERVAAKQWGLPLQRLTNVLAPGRDVRSTVGPWRRDCPEYASMVITVATAMLKLLFTEPLPDRVAETTSADVLLDFAGRVYPAETADPSGETLTAALGVSVSAGTPTLRFAGNEATCPTTEPGAVVRAA
jgi:hypothetical protein